MQHVEDMVSKALFKFHGVDDDAIVASMHHYISGKNQDEKIMEEIRSSLESLNSLLFPPTTVEFDPASLDSPELAAGMLQSVLNAMTSLTTFIHKVIHCVITIFAQQDSTHGIPRVGHKKERIASLTHSRFPFISALLVPWRIFIFCLLTWMIFERV